MVIFRCTGRVVRRFRIQPQDDVPALSGILGDWYVSLLNIGPTRLVLCQSERSLLPVIIPARNAPFPSAFAPALAAILQGLGIREDLVTREVAASSEVAFSKPRSRRVLGAMNDFAFQAKGYFSTRPRADNTVAICLELAQMPSRPIGYQSADRLTAALFQSGRLQLGM
ncbi:MAG: hypothetical protein AB1411_12905 [Nitrospirota bacterium]